MHGNLGASGAHSDSGLSGCALWLGDPSARALFDPSTLCAADRERLERYQHPARASWRREGEFKVSRALKAFTNVEGRSHSLSHSAGHAALLITPAGMRIGVDLEAISPRPAGARMDASSGGSRRRDVLRIARFAFDEREIAALEASPADARDELFYSLWTMKEALGKALQLSLLDALSQCVFYPDSRGWTGRTPAHAPWSVQVFRPRLGFLLAAAYVGISQPPKVEMWEWPPQRAAEWPVIAACASARADAGAPPA